jgi:serine/threonine protein kinase
MVDNFENERSIYVVLEYLEGGDLYDFMLKRGFDLPENFALKFSY